MKAKIQNQKNKTEQEFQRELGRKKQVERQKAEKVARLSWEKRAKNFLESDSVASQTTKVALALVVAGGALTIISVAPGLTILARHYKRSQYSLSPINNVTEPEADIP